MSNKILIVEDDPFTRLFYKQLFGKTSYEIVQTEDGDQVIVDINDSEYVLAILDINLKNTYLNGEKTDGIKLSKTIKEQEQSANIPILLVTAYQKSFGSNDFLIQSKADDYITKPIIDFNLLLNKVDSLVEKNDRRKR